MQHRAYAAVAKTVSLGGQEVTIELGIRGIGMPEPDYRRLDAVSVHLAPEEALQLYRMLEAVVRPRLVTRSTGAGSETPDRPEQARA